MPSDPYAALVELHGALQIAAQQIGKLARHPDSLARLEERDQLRARVDEALAAAGSLAELIDWADESDLPPGLRAALDQPRWTELSTAQSGSLPNPIEAGEPLRALVHTEAMGEAYDIAHLDLADLGLGADYDPANPEHRHWLYRFRLRATAQDLDLDAGPFEHASLYLDTSGARRLAAALRQRVADGRQLRAVTPPPPGGG